MLNFGSYLWPPYVDKMDAVLQLAHVFKRILSLTYIYICEAHAIDEHFVLESNTKAGICIRQPRTLQERLSVARTYASTLPNAVPFYVDDPATDIIANAYEARPERLVVVDSESVKIVWFSGQGPFQYNVAGLRTWLETVTQD